MPFRGHSRLPFALPSAHFMAFAPLDAWARALIRGGTFIAPRYWLRLAWCLFTSTLATAITLPERIVLAPFLALSRRRGFGHRPGVVVILGYYRSGTTHLHYLLSCDPRFTTPRWYQVLAPVGFVLSWQLLRWVMTPFVSSKRPQDDVALGPEWPAEDDFAVSNAGGACTMPGRMLVPRAWERFIHLNDIENAPEADRDSFNRTLFAFCWKLARLAPSRTILLKTPAHTARIAELVRLFGTPAAAGVGGSGGVGGVRFIHLSRDASAVLRSNVAMHPRIESYFLQDVLDESVIRERITAEYDEIERAFLRDSAALPPHTLTRIRYQDLIADPLGQLRRAYAELELELTPEVEQRFASYLHTVSDYRAVSDKPVNTSSREPSAEALPEKLAWMHTAFGHDRPAVPRIALPPFSSRPRPFGFGYLAAAITALLGAALWLAIAAATRDRMDLLIWPVGIAIGIAALRASGAGNGRLGLFAAAAVLFTYFAVAFPATYLSCNDYWKRDGYPWSDVWDSTRDGVLAMNNIFWAVLGIGTAYRFASRKHVRPPGM